jgi:hypothetical protein
VFIPTLESVIGRRIRKQNHLLRALKELHIELIIIDKEVVKRLGRSLSILNKKEKKFEEESKQLSENIDRIEQFVDIEGKYKKKDLEKLKGRHGSLEGYKAAIGAPTTIHGSIKKYKRMIFLYEKFIKKVEYYDKRINSFFNDDYLKHQYDICAKSDIKFKIQYDYRLKQLQEWKQGYELLIQFKKAYDLGNQEAMWVAADKLYKKNLLGRWKPHGTKSGLYGFSGVGEQHFDSSGSWNKKHHSNSLTPTYYARRIARIMLHDGYRPSRRSNPVGFLGAKYVGAIFFYPKVHNGYGGDKALIRFKCEGYCLFEIERSTHGLTHLGNEFVILTKKPIPPKNLTLIVGPRADSEFVNELKRLGVPFIIR